MTRTEVLVMIVMMILTIILVLILIIYEQFLTRYLLITLDEVMLKNTKPDSVATAFARRVFPVPI